MAAMLFCLQEGKAIAMAVTFHARTDTNTNPLSSYSLLPLFLTWISLSAQKTTRTRTQLYNYNMVYLPKN